MKNILLIAMFIFISSCGNNPFDKKTISSASSDTQDRSTRSSVQCRSDEICSVQIISRDPVAVSFSIPSDETSSYDLFYCENGGTDCKYYLDQITCDQGNCVVTRYNSTVETSSNGNSTTVTVEKFEKMFEGETIRVFNSL